MTDILMQNAKVREIVEICEDHADQLIRKSRHYLPHIARFCLIATFLEDGLRLITQFSDQVSYIASVWDCATFFGGLFILINIVTQFCGSGFILTRYRVTEGCALLMGTVIFQTIGYRIWTRVFLVRNLSLCGSLLLLLAETKQEDKGYMSGLPSTGENASREYMLFGGRILVVLMFLTLLHWTGSFFYFLQSAANLVLILAVAVGYRTKLCAVMLVVWLTLMNFIYNNFWAMHYDGAMWDFLKYDFFQTWSVIGGLILIVSYGPGGVSVDDYKKKW